MKKNYKYVLCFVWVSISFNCNNEVDMVSSSGTNSIIDIEGAPELDQYFYDRTYLNVDSIRFLPLEQTNNSLISEVEKLIFCDDSFIVFDEDQNRVMRFDSKTGEFLNSFGSYGKGPGEFFDIRDVAYNNTGELVYLFDYANREILCFNISGSFRGEKSFSIPEDLIFNAIEYYSGFLVGVNYLFTGEYKDKIIIMDSNNGKIVGSGLRSPYVRPPELNPILGKTGRYPKLHRGHDGIYITEYLNDTLYRLTGNGEIENYIMLNFNTLYPSEEFLKESDRTKLERIVASRFTFGVERLAISEDYIFLKYYYGDLDQGTNQYIIYHKDNQFVFDCGYEFQVDHIPVYPIHYGSDTTLVSCTIYPVLKSYQYLFEINKKNNPDAWNSTKEKLSHNIDTYLSEHPDYTNPVLFVYSIADD